MIALPENEKQWMQMSRFLNHYAGVHPSADLKMIGWASGDKLRCVVGLNGFMGSVCQIHVAYEEGWKYTPKELLTAVFSYAFGDGGRELLIGIVNSHNKQAMRFDEHLGFKELLRLKGMHDEGGDLVILGMRKDECVYLENKDVQAA